MSLPKGWIRTSLGELVTPRSDRVDPATWPDAKYIGLEHVEPQTSQILATVEAGQMSSSSARFAAGDVLYGRMRPYLNKVVRPAFEGLASAEFIVMPPNEAIDGDFLLRRLSAADFVEFACGQYEGDRPRVKFEQLADFAILLPPRSEQRKMAMALDESLANLDAASAELLQAKRKLALYRQSLLRSAVEGTLTADWREQNPPKETGADLLTRILSERRARWEARQLQKFKAQGKEPPKHWQNDYRHPVAPDLNGLPTLPLGWTWASAGQLLDSLTSGSRDWAPYYGRGNCTFVMAQNVRPWRPDFSFRQAVDPPAFDRDRTRSEIRMDDLLVTIVGANTGQACRVANSLPLHFVCQSVALLRPVFSETSEFMNAVLNSPAHGQRYFDAMNYGAGRPHLSFEQLELLPVPLPPLSEQAAIAEALILRLEALDDQEMAIEHGLRLATAQRQNILRAAFSGQLVPQDPSDEPASVLLERIRAQRQAAAPATKRKPGRPAKVTA